MDWMDIIADLQANLIKTLLGEDATHDDIQYGSGDIYVHYLLSLSSSSISSLVNGPGEGCVRVRERVSVVLCSDRRWYNKGLVSPQANNVFSLFQCSILRSAHQLYADDNEFHNLSLYVRHNREKRGNLRVGDPTIDIDLRAPTDKTANLPPLTF
ncbi:unnamed protein product [Rotaria socialis]|uniref:Uncharacterized protein n=1 Tax=Rotaria socialis TaxID=392032 RepID=A0A817MHI5_9BILA|nr:unnamed protein product [Rotaria socialis]CAF4237650.1 unnamed protein product [Rotaria socialis]CAF4453719.1 unnamed protein product [Rotaria socialis]